MRVRLGDRTRVHHRSLEPLVDRHCANIGQFGFGQWPEPQDASPTGEGFADGGYGQEVGGSCEQESTGGRVSINELFHGAHESVATKLNLVHRQRVALVDEECDRVGKDRFSGGVVVEGHVGAAALFGDEPCERGLSALAGAVHDHDTKPIEGLVEPRSQVSLDQRHGSIPFLISNLPFY